MIRPPGIDNGAFVVSPDSVWYAGGLLLSTATSQTDTGLKRLTVHLCRRWKHMTILKTAINVIIVIIVIIDIIHVIVLVVVY